MTWFSLGNSHLRLTFANYSGMRNTEEIRNRALRNRPTKEHTKEVLEIIRKRAEEDVDSNVLFDEGLLRRASVTRPNEPLPSIRVDPGTAKRRSCPADLNNEEADFIPKYRWRSLSDAPLLEREGRSPGDRLAASPARSDTCRKERRVSLLSTNLPPLEAELRHNQLERPSCVPSLHRNDVLILPKGAINVNSNYEDEDLFTVNGVHHHDENRR